MFTFTLKKQISDQILYLRSELFKASPHFLDHHGLNFSNVNILAVGGKLPVCLQQPVVGGVTTGEICNGSTGIIDFASFNFNVVLLRDC